MLIKPPSETVPFKPTDRILLVGKQFLALDHEPPGDLAGCGVEIIFGIDATPLESLACSFEGTEMGSDCVEFSPCRCIAT